MKLLRKQDWENSASFRDSIPQQIEIKLHYEMYEFARQLEAQNHSTEFPTFHIYFQKALSIFHRFAHQISFRKYDRYIYMTASLFLSSKDLDMFHWAIERYVKTFLTICSSKFKSKPVEGFPNLLPIIDNTTENKLIQLYTEKILDAESHILQLIGYDLNIVVPQIYFNEAKKHLTIAQGDVQKLFDAAQKLISDLFFTKLCLYYEPKILTLFAIHKAAVLQKMTIQDLKNGQPWYALFNNEGDQLQTYNEILEVQKYFDECVKQIK